jgi:O-antigen ligase
MNKFYVEKNEFKTSIENRKIKIFPNLFGLRFSKISYFLVIIITEISLIAPKKFISLAGHELRISVAYFFIVALIIYFLSHYLVRGKITIQKDALSDKFIGFIIIWWVIVFFSTLINPIINSGLVPYFFENLENLFKWSSGLLFLLIGLKLIKWKEDDLKIIIDMLIFASTIISIILLIRYNLLSSYSQLTGNLSWSFWEDVAKHEIPEVLAMISIITVSIISEQFNLLKRIFYFISIAITIAVIMFFFSRETYVTILIGLLTLLIVKDMKKINKFILFILFLAFVFIFFQLNFGQFLISSIEEFYINPNKALSARMDRWISAIKIGIEHPLIGVGFSGFQYFVGPGGGTSAHNAYLQAFVVGGIPGFFIFIAIITNLVIAVRKCLRLSRHFIKAFSEGFFSILIGYLFSALFSDHFFTFYYFSLIFWGLFAVLVRVVKKTQKIIFI